MNADKLRTELLRSCTQPGTCKTAAPGKILHVLEEYLTVTEPRYPVPDTEAERARIRLPWSLAHNISTRMWYYVPNGDLYEPPRIPHLHQQTPVSPSVALPR